MKKTLQDLERIITQGPIPEHAHFRDRLFQQLSTQTVPDLKPRSMIKKIFSPWTFTPIVLGIAVAAFFFLQYKPTSDTKNIAPTYVFSKAAFAASLESSFGWSSYDTLHYRRIVFYNARYPMQSIVRDIWQYQNNYRLDNYTLPQYSSHMNSAEELKKCLTVKSYDPLNTAKGVHVRTTARCESDVASDGFYTPTEDTTAIGSADEDTMTVTLFTAEALDEKDVLLLEIIDPDVQVAVQGPTANFISTDTMQLNTPTDTGYTHALHFEYGMNIGLPDADVLWRFQILHEDKASAVFELNLHTLETRTVSLEQTSSSVTLNEHYSAHIQELFEVASTDTEPLTTRNTYYHDLPAIEIDFPTQDSTIMTFTQLMVDGRIVEAKKIHSNGDLLYRITIEQDHAVNDQNPEAFFTEEYWKAEMKNDVLTERLDAGAARMVKQWMLDMPGVSPTE